MLFYCDLLFHDWNIYRRRCKRGQQVRRLSAMILLLIVHRRNKKKRVILASPNPLQFSLAICTLCSVEGPSSQITVNDLITDTFSYSPRSWTSNITAPAINAKPLSVSRGTNYSSGNNTRFCCPEKPGEKWSETEKHVQTVWREPMFCGLLRKHSS